MWVKYVGAECGSGLSVWVQYVSVVCDDSMIRIILHGQTCSGPGLDWPVNVGRKTLNFVIG